MKPIFVTGCVVLSLAAMLGSPAVAADPKPLLRISFDANKTDADAATGSARATIENYTGDAAAKVEFGTSLPGFGTALVIGEKPIGLGYDLKGNIRQDKGALTFWFRRVGLRPKVGTGGGLYRYDVLRLDGENGVSCWVYKWEHFGNMTLLRLANGAGKYTMTLTGDADDGQWHFIAFTWAGTRMRGYFDGAFSSEEEKYELPVFQKLVIGDFHAARADEATRRLIDDVTIYGEALTSSELKRLYRQGHGMDAPATLTIPPRKHPITIDGKISAEEWAGAVETTGFADLRTGLSAATQTRARLCYDDQALYIALRSEFPQRVKDDAAMTIGMTGALRQTKTAFDTDVDADDSIEIHVEPQAATNRYCRLVVNGLNTHYDYEVTGDYRAGKMGNIRLAWNPAWESATFLDGEGWQAEIKIPFGAFGAPPPKPGDTWGLSLLRRWVALQTGEDGWGFLGRELGGGVSYGHETAPVKFGSADSPVIALKDWGDVGQGFVKLDATISNPSDKELALNVEVASDSKELQEARTLVVPKGGSVPLNVSRKLKDFTTSQVMMTVRAADTNMLFRSGQLLSIPEELRVDTAHYPSKGILRIAVDAGRLSDLPLAELSLRVRMLDASGKSVALEKTVSPMPSYQCVAELDVSKLTPASYVVDCAIAHKNKNVFERRIDFAKRKLPEWFGNSIGITDKAPKPFTPVARKGNTLGCWERTYSYGAGLFPKQITTKGNEILSRPIELSLTDATGKTFSSVTRLNRSWGKRTDFRIEYTAKAKLGGFPVSATCWMECDGLVWTRLAVGPSSRPVQKLVLRIPLRKPWAEYVNTSDYSTRNDGFLPKEGLQGSQAALWLGNGYGGLQWIVESYAACKLPKGEPALRVISAERETVLEISLIKESVVLDQPFVQEFGLIATPVRPPTPEYRQWNTYMATWFPEVSWNETSTMNWSAATTFLYAGNPTVLKSALAGLRPPKRPDGVSPTTVLAPHVMVAQVDANDAEFAYWGDEWSPTANGRKLAGPFGITSTSSRSWRDFFVWNYAHVYQRVRMPGVYYDCDMEAIDDNDFHGGGLRVGGQVVAKPSILGTRQLMQRMYVMLREREPERTMIGLHSSGFLNLGYMAWCDWYGDGENFVSLLSKQNPDYHKLYRPDSFLAKSMGHNTGLTVRFLDEQNRANVATEEDWKRLGPQPTLHLYGLILLHDSVFWHAYGNPIAYKMVNDALIKYNFDERYRVLAWYFDQKIVALPPDVFATFYKDDATGCVLIVLLNNNEQKLDLQLALDWKALGIRELDKASVDDAIFHEGASIRDGKLFTPIGAANMRLIVVEPGEEKSTLKERKP